MTCIFGDNMKSYKFLVPVGFAVAGISPAHANVASSISEIKSASTNDVNGQHTDDAVVQKITYQINNGEHGLLMKRAETGVLYAYHQSHRPHGSHGSHN